MRGLARFACAVPVLLSLLVCPNRASGQCPSWESGFGANGTDGSVTQLIVFDNGLEKVLIAGGGFTTAGGVAANAIASWDGSTWSAVGGGLTNGGFVRALAVYDDGTGPALYMAGFFDTVEGQTANNIAKWNGANWSPLGSGVQCGEGSTGHGFANIAAMAVADFGSGPMLFAGGRFGCSDPSIPLSGIAQWNGTNWSDVGGGLSVWFSTDAMPYVTAMAVFDDGSGPALYVAGSFDHAGSTLAYGTAKWDGTQWSAFGGTVTGYIHAMTVLDDGTGPALYAGGWFDSAAGVAAKNIAKWGGSVWSALGSGLWGGAGDPGVSALVAFDDGSGPALYAGGGFVTAGSIVANGIAKWDGVTWSALGSGMDAGTSAVESLASFSDGSGVALYAGGSFTTAGGLNSNNIAAWSGCLGSGAGTSFCFGDGSSLACPCSNNGAPGHGCENSSATGGAQLVGSGGARLSADTVVLTSSGELASELSIFFQGDSSLVLPVRLGDGLRCVGGNLKRLYLKRAIGGIAVAPSTGEPAISVRSVALGDSIQAGQARSYHVYYRDLDPNFCAAPSGNTFNVSQALRILWAP